ncbi:hypothetical protein Pcinc_038606 [Petrolisthes cinctipes]|uniref:Uncharacterized protein n=1 Tax=Petrolisthes cinctipes TaxID=88211 RepID=A0AAE1BQC1_PETCI|nr:hypothetical protein Pcinc_038606 [Petrolisthes cinctipes]
MSLYTQPTLPSIHQSIHPSTNSPINPHPSTNQSINQSNVPLHPNNSPINHHQSLSIHQSPSIHQPNVPLHPTNPPINPSITTHQSINQMSLYTQPTLPSIHLSPSINQPNVPLQSTNSPINHHPSINQSTKCPSTPNQLSHQSPSINPSIYQMSLYTQPTNSPINPSITPLPTPTAGAGEVLGKAVKEATGDERETYITLVLDWAMSWGTWGQAEYCPPGTFATAFEIKVESEDATDDTSMNGIRLYCNDVSGDDNKQTKELTVSSTVQKWGDWMGKRECPSGEVLTGLRMKSEEDQGNFVDDTAANDLDMQCLHSTFTLNGGGNHWDIGVPGLRVLKGGASVVWKHE